MAWFVGNTLFASLMINDDQQDEIDRFCHILGDRFAVGAGTSLDIALEDLRAKGHSNPDLFLVDLYFQAGPTLDSQRLGGANRCLTGNLTFVLRILFRSHCVQPGW